MENDDAQDMIQLEKILEIVRAHDIEDISTLCSTIVGSNPCNFNEKGESTHEEMSSKKCNEESEKSIIHPETLVSLTTKNFGSRDELLDVIRNICLKQGYAIVIKKSKTGYYVVVGCDRGGKYRGNALVNQRKKVSATRLIQCPFEVWGKRKADGIWKIEIKNLSHNHASSGNMSGHPTCRRLSIEEMQLVKDMTLAGAEPRQILSALRKKNPELLAIARTIYNARTKIRNESLAGKTMLQALFDEFGKSGFIYDMDHDRDGRLTHLFFAHPYSVTLTKSYQNVFIMDCTYQTNRYKMPILEIVGVTSFSTSFFSCFSALQKEEVEDYVWALRRFSEIIGDDRYPLTIITDRELALINAVELVFPKTTHLLCVWHINKNITAKCKKQFETKKEWEDFLLGWTNVIQSSEESLFDEYWEAFEKQYNEKSSVLDYIRDTWLPLKTKFVYAWTENHLHFGTHVTSRAEGAHAIVKRYLQVSTGNLREVKNKICLAIENQFHEIKTQLYHEKIRFPHKFRIPLFSELLTYVSTYALEELFKQYEYASSDKYLFPCKGHFQKTMGLPCAHKMRCMIDGVLPLEDIHPQWRIDIRSFTNADEDLERPNDNFDSLLKEFSDKYKQLPLIGKEEARKQIAKFVDTPLPLIREPQVLPHKGRPWSSNKRQCNSSTKRHPSAFELVDKTRKCSLCHRDGHNSRTCEKRDA